MSAIRKNRAMDVRVSKFALSLLTGLLIVVASLGAISAIFYSPSALAAGGQCRWEGGPGVSGGYLACKAEDCIGDGGLAQCSVPEPAASPSFTDAELGPDKWVYDLCQEGLPSIPAENRWCTAAGGTLACTITGCACNGLPPDALHGNPTLSAEEEDVMIRTKAYADLGGPDRCTTPTLKSDTGWDATLSYISCAGGPTTYKSGLPTRSLRRIVWRVEGGHYCDADHTFTVSKYRDVKCPSGYKTRKVGTTLQCYLPAECCEARVGNPVSMISGAKFQREVDYQPGNRGGLELIRYYNSAGYFRAPALGVLPGPLDGMIARDYWRHNYDVRLFPVTGNSEVMAIEQLPDGVLRTFDAAGKEAANRDGAGARLTAVSAGYEVTRGNSDVYRYNSAGQLVAIVTRAGMTTTLTYSNDLLDTVTDQFGHRLTFGYTNGLLTSVTLPDGSAVQYGYDDYRRPVTVTYPDTTTRRYTYGEVGRAWLLTAIVDENNQQFAQYTYNADGAVISESHAGGVGQYSFTYNATSTTATDPLGADTVYAFSATSGTVRRSAQSQPCFGCSSFASRTFDTQGNLASTTDFNGNQTLYSFDPARNLETSRTEAAGSSVARTIQTQWHPTYRMPTQIDEPGRRTTFSHDTNGNVLTRTVTDLDTDASRTWTYTYNDHGQVLTVDGPRTDVSDVTTTTYHECSNGYECGEVATVTDAVGNQTSYLTYNAHGQPLTMSDPNGVVTTFAYDERQRLISRESNGETAAFSYYPTGQLKRATLPDGSYLEYSYDAAHRLTGMKDGAGNRIAYVLNAAGQPSVESVYDPSDVLTRTQGWVYDTLGRALSSIDAYNNSTGYTYDTNGNLETITDPELRVTTRLYDALNRQNGLVDAMSGLIEYSYSGRDELERVQDARSLATGYRFNGLGDVIRLDSPDTGVTTYNRNAAGNVRQVTDARNQTATYTYDATDRVTQIAYSDQTIQFTYDQGAYGRGHLTHLSDAAGSTHWTYDALGRVATKQQVTGSVPLNVGYLYNSAGQLSQITTPSGQLITYTYDNGRIASVSVNSSTVLNGALYTGWGAARGWSWGNGTLAVREYDLNGRISVVDSSDMATYQYNSDGTIQSWTRDDSAPGESGGLTEFDVDADSNQLLSSGGAVTRAYSYDDAGNMLSDGVRTFTYNGAGRMVAASNGGVTAAYAYNGLGQRVRKTLIGQDRLFVYDEAGHLLGEYAASGELIQETVWLDDIPVAVLKPSGAGVSVAYIHTDHLSTPRRITRPADNIVIWSWSSDPFGLSPANEDPDGDGVAFAYGLRFPGQYHDAETGLHYNYYRDYDPANGRYVKSDPIGLDGGTNTYLYASGNPLANVDPLGLFNVRAYETFDPAMDSYSWRYEFSFGSCLAGLANMFGSRRLPPALRRLISGLGVLRPDPAGDVDISSFMLRCRCQQLDSELKETFEEQFGGSLTYSQSEAKEILQALKRKLKEIEGDCPECVEAYNWNNILPTAAERGQESLRRRRPGG